MIKNCLQILLAIDGVVQHSQLKEAPGDIDIYVPPLKMNNAAAICEEFGFVFQVKNINQCVALKYEDAKLYIFDLVSNYNMLTFDLFDFTISDVGNTRLGQDPILAKRLKRFINKDMFDDSDGRLVSFFKDSSNYKSSLDGEICGLNLIYKKITKNRIIYRVIASLKYRYSRLGKGKSFAFIGPDGSGKSYIIDLLQHSSVSKKQYMGDWFFFLLPIYKLLLKIPSPYNRFVYILFFIENYLRGIKVRLFRMLGVTVLIDRFPGTNRSSIHATGSLSKINRLFYKLSIKPDYFVVLYAEPEIVYGRKQELSVHEIDLCQKSILNVVKFDRHIVCNTEQLDISLNNILKIIHS
ncbi:hypothetical protein HWV01_03275 [Moritella sp. 5]|uniref:hypothetical protein n=1 Tax=Moritella sp. 5 TaxID=2746231 RepID=UPI001BAC1262|nr:hypothetical protein [Moritella sp. 5]QUM79393.1 hypothetical protein HWV01_03275 [Moritella sp. 5]